MQLCGTRPMTIFTMAVAISRQASGFVVAPTRVVARHRTGGGAVSRTNVRCRMAISEAATSGVIAGSVPVLDAQAAGLKAERLWGMADAEKPREVQEAVQSRLRDYPEMSVDDLLERDEFVEEEAEVSALRRYQYDELVDCENENDDKEYYI